MGCLLPVTVGCISLLSVLLPGTLSRRLGPRPLLTRPREPPDRLSSQDLESQAVMNVHPVAFVDQPETHLQSVVGHHPGHPPHPHHRHRKLRGSRGRGRRHARRHHAQLKRTGCGLSTCQVQNLSHRLKQLIGQKGKQDSAPINPKSPHSYG